MSRRNVHTVRNRQLAVPPAGVVNRRGGTAGKRARGTGGKIRTHYMPPETWYEPRVQSGYRIAVQDAGEGYRHVLTPDDIRTRLAKLPDWMTRDLQVVQLSRMTRKKATFPCYGMQWGQAIYLYPVEVERVEHFSQAPRPAQIIEAKQFGVCWEHVEGGWRLEWSEDALRDFYLNNVLIHELGHLLDQRNTNYADRERYAEWFALEYGYKTSRSRVSRKSLAAQAASNFCRDLGG